MYCGDQRRRRNNKNNAMDTKDRHRRHSIRLKNYDYSRAGAYFLTLCAWKKECHFGIIENSEIRMNEIGRIIDEEWLRTPMIRKEIDLDVFIVMPNHIHGIVVINDGVNGEGAGDDGVNGDGANNDRANNDGANGRSPLPGHNARLQMRPKSVSSFVAGYKSAVTARINRLRNTPGAPVWQRNYYEHIIRDENELSRIREYIMTNPLKWAEDKENPLNP